MIAVSSLAAPRESGKDHVEQLQLADPSLSNPHWHPDAPCDPTAEMYTAKRGSLTEKLTILKHTLLKPPTIARRARSNDLNDDDSKSVGSFQ